MCDISVKYIGINVYFVAEMCDISVKDPGEKPSPESLCGEKPSGEKPSNFSSGENPSASFAACGENPSPFFFLGGGGGMWRKTLNFIKSPQISLDIQFFI